MHSLDDDTELRSCQLLSWSFEFLEKKKKNRNKFVKYYRRGNPVSNELRKMVTVSNEVTEEHSNQHGFVTDWKLGLQRYCPWIHEKELGNQKTLSLWGDVYFYL